MSSILEALKKAELESTMDRSADTPWPAPLPPQPSYRQRSRSLWAPLGLVVGLCVVAVVFWQVRQPPMKRSGDSVSATPPPQTPKPNQQVPPSAAEAPPTRTPIAQQQQVPSAKTLADVSPRQSTKNDFASTVQVPDPMVGTAPDQPDKQPLRGPIEASEPMPAPAEDSSRHPMGSAIGAGQAKAAPADTEKIFKDDPRIDLQALVWAPESTARFVVINNRLIKEGGSLDNIVVVQINPDDVLLAEGADRWHEAFNIR